MFRRLWHRMKDWWNERRANRQLLLRYEVDDIERLEFQFVLEHEFSRVKGEWAFGSPDFRLLPPVTMADYVVRVVLWILVSVLLLIVVLAISFDIARALGYLPST